MIPQQGAGWQRQVAHATRIKATHRRVRSGRLFGAALETEVVISRLPLLKLVHIPYTVLENT